MDTERTAFEREREFARERIGREEKRLEVIISIFNLTFFTKNFLRKDLKANHQMENQRWQKQLQDDRIAILAEKSKLETLERLQRPSEISTSRAEIDAAVQVAQVSRINENLPKLLYNFTVILRMQLVSLIWNASGTLSNSENSKVVDVN